MLQTDRHRTIWLSDIHLGSRDCRVELLLDFLDRNRCEQLYLVGDIIDIKRMRRSFFWPKSHTDALQKILAMASDGTRIVYVPGNHDDDFRSFAGSPLGPVEVQRKTIHRTADGRRLLVLHGDEFDSALRCNALASLIGCAAYGLLLGLNRVSHRINTLLGRPYWSLAQAVKLRFGKAAQYVERFESACLQAAREARVDGVVCGHIHRAALMRKDDLLYCNDGDWVESCTALVENAHGQLSLLHWGQRSAEISTQDVVQPLRDAA